jgi:phosphate acetyltransferase
MESLNALMQRASRGGVRRIVFPEGDEPVIRAAAVQLAEAGLARPILIAAAEEANLLSSAIDIVAPAGAARLASYAERLARSRDMPAGAARRLVAPPLGFAAAMVAAGDADGMVAGLRHPTEEVLLAAEMVIGLAPGVTAPSSFFLMEIPRYSGGEGGALVFADPAVNPEPDAEALAVLAVTTARSAAAILGWRPRVALLSFSTKCSADHPRVAKVVEATQRARAMAPDLAIDGELQADAALVEAVARRKMNDLGEVAGRANILIFPDLDSANIGAKLVQRLAGAASHGPVLQGFAKPVSDLSRGANVEDVVGAALMVAIRCD